MAVFLERQILKLKLYWLEILLLVTEDASFFTEYYVIFMQAAGYQWSR